jgi:hypothetical protein
MSDNEDDGDMDDIMDDIPTEGLGPDGDEGSPVVSTPRVHARDNPLQAMLASKKAREEEREKKLEKLKGACGRGERAEARGVPSADCGSARGDGGGNGAAQRRWSGSRSWASRTRPWRRSISS